MGLWGGSYESAARVWGGALGVWAGLPDGAEGLWGGSGAAAFVWGGRLADVVLVWEVGLGLMGACACGVERSGAAAREAACAGLAAVS